MQSKQPPKWADKFLKWYCAPELLEEIQGDIHELFFRRKATNIARLLFIWDVIRFLRWSNIKQQKPQQKYMVTLFKNYFRIAQRNLIKHKLFSTIHLAGLTIGLFVTALLLFYVQYEYSFDTQHSKANRIFRLTHTEVINDKKSYEKASVFPELGMELEATVPSIETSVRLFAVASEYEPVFSFENNEGEQNQFTESSLYLADSTITDIFDFKWISGDAHSVLHDPNQLIISESLAMRVFKTTDVKGKNITWQGMGTWEIVGVFQDWPKQSHLHFDALASWFKVYGERSLTRWDGFYTYILAKPNTDYSSLENDISASASNYLNAPEESGNSQSHIGLQPLTDIHLNSHLANELEVNGNSQVVNGLLIIAIVILVLAVFNYINLASSHASQRAREVGVRKLLGSNNRQIRVQFLVESFCLVFLAHIIALALVQLTIPTFNQWIGADINFGSWYTSISFWLGYFASVLLITILSGFYPALIMSYGKPLSLLEKISYRGNSSFRKVLMLLQFSAAIVLSMLAMIVFNQVDFITNKNLGFNENLLILKSMELVSDNSDTAFVSKMETLKHKLSTSGDLGKATLTSHIPGVINNWIGEINVPSSQSVVNVARVRVDEDFLGVYDIELLAGRYYHHRDEVKSLTNIVVNRSLARAFGFKTPSEAIGAKLSVFRGSATIIAVIEDFHMQSPKQEIIPSMYTLGAGHKAFLSIKLNNNQYQRAVSETRDRWKEVFPNKPFEYFFIDGQMKNQFVADQRLTEALGNFALLAVFLACLGLFGLSNYTTSLRLKELSIRKIFGASGLNLLKLLVTNQLSLVIISGLVACPVVYLFANKWLKQYAFKIDVGPEYYLIPIIAIALVAFLTVFINTWKVITSNIMVNIRKDST